MIMVLPLDTSRVEVEIVDSLTAYTTSSIKEHKKAYEEMLL